MTLTKRCMDPPPAQPTDTEKAENMLQVLKDQIAELANSREEALFELKSLLRELSSMRAQVSAERERLYQISKAQAEEERKLIRLGTTEEELETLRLHAATLEEIKDLLARATN